MKIFFYNVLVWVSGADTNLLKDCPESEHKKYAQQGGLILIPTTLAFISMLFATSLLTTDTGIRIILSFVWAIIIFIIDRYIVSTFIKKESGWDWFSIQFFIRIIFAVGLGIVISHPIIIRIFDDKIQETQTEIWQSSKDNIEQEVFSKRDTANAGFEDRLSKLIYRADTLDMVIAAEIAGANTIIGGYYVSNLLGSGTRVANYKKDRDSIRSEIFDLKDKIKNNNDSAYTKRDEKIKEMEESLAKGYWGKDDALTIYLDKSKKWSIYWLILIFFIFVDVTAVLLKVFTQYGEYDDKLSQRENCRTETNQFKINQEIAAQKAFWEKLLTWKDATLTNIFTKHADGKHEDLIRELKEVLNFTIETSKSEKSNTAPTEEPTEIPFVWELLGNPIFTISVLIVLAPLVHKVIVPHFF